MYVSRGDGVEKAYIPNISRFPLNLSLFPPIIFSILIIHQRHAQGLEADSADKEAAKADIELIEKIR